jgi:hypothetical protein
MAQSWRAARRLCALAVRVQDGFTRASKVCPAPEQGPGAARMLTWPARTPKQPLPTTYVSNGRCSRLVSSRMLHGHAQSIRAFRIYVPAVSALRSGPGPASPCTERHRVSSAVFSRYTIARRRAPAAGAAPFRDRPRRACTRVLTSAKPHATSTTAEARPSTARHARPAHKTTVPVASQGGWRATHLAKRAPPGAPGPRQTFFRIHDGFRGGIPAPTRDSAVPTVSLDLCVSSGEVARACVRSSSRRAGPPWPPTFALRNESRELWPISSCLKKESLGEAPLYRLGSWRTTNFVHISL